MEDMVEHKPNMIWASPPCTHYSDARTYSTLRCIMCRNISLLLDPVASRFCCVPRLLMSPEKR
eukprot:8617709-Lingulodinium_polyedra.AAC.1